MQTFREPATARRLQDVLDELARSASTGRRPNPAALRYALDVQSPDPDQTGWRDLGSYAEKSGALDEAAISRLEPRTVVRVRKGAQTVWLGFADERGSGELVLARPLPRRRPVGLRTWVDAWHGHAAEGPWMLRQCAHVATQPSGVQTLTLAACACAMTGSLPEGSTSVLLRRAVRWAESWARGGALRSDALEYALEAESAAGSLKGTDLVAANGIVDAVSLPHRTGSDLTAALAASAAEYASLSRKLRAGIPANDRSEERELAAVVRGFVSLGMALAAPA